MDLLRFETEFLSSFHWQLASGAIFGPNVGIVGHWFLKRRGLAFGFTAAGSSIGGTIFPIAARKLIPRVGSVTIIKPAIPGYLCAVPCFQFPVDYADYWVHSYSHHGHPECCPSATNSAKESIRRFVQYQSLQVNSIYDVYSIVHCRLLRVIYRQARALAGR